MRRVAWFRTVIDVEDETIVQAWLSTVHAMFEGCLQLAEDQTDGRIKVVDLEGGQSFGLREVEPADRDDV
jgi:hypothetical protein